MAGSPETSEAVRKIAGLVSNVQIKHGPDTNPVYRLATDEEGKLVLRAVGLESDKHDSGSPK